MQQNMSTWMARNDGGATPGDREKHNAAEHVNRPGWPGTMAGQHLGIERNTMQQDMSTWMARNDGGATPGDREKHNAAEHVNLDGQERWRGNTWG